MVRVEQVENEGELDFVAVDAAHIVVLKSTEDWQSERLQRVIAKWLTTS